MSVAYRIGEKEGAYFLTFQIVGWVDILVESVIFVIKLALPWKTY
jgi:hypothetical protein